MVIFIVSNLLFLLVGVFMRNMMNYKVNVKPRKMIHPKAMSDEELYDQEAKQKADGFYEEPEELTFHTPSDGKMADEENNKKYDEVPNDSV
jgi:hypothetical protein